VPDFLGLVVSRHSNNPHLGGDFDARLQFLLQSSESLHASLQELRALNTEQTERINEIEARFNARAEILLSASETLLAILQAHQKRLDKIDGGQH
jgi:hypothetical protein